MSPGRCTRKLLLCERNPSLFEEISDALATLLQSAVGYLPSGSMAAGVILPEVLPMAPLAPLPPRLDCIPGSAKSGLALSTISSLLCDIFRGGGCSVGPGGGLHCGLTPRWLTEVKCDASLSVGERAPSGMVAASSKAGSASLLLAPLLGIASGVSRWNGGDIGAGEGYL